MLPRTILMTKSIVKEELVFGALLVGNYGGPTGGVAAG